MIYIKSLMVGIATVLMATLLAIFGAGLYMYNASKSIENGAMGWDPVSLLKKAVDLDCCCSAIRGRPRLEFRRAAK